MKSKCNKGCKERWECYGQCLNNDIMKNELQKHAAEIILLRYEEAGIFDPNYDKEPLPLELEIAEEIINLCMDAAIQKAMTEMLRSGFTTTARVIVNDAIESLKVYDEN